VKFFLLSVFITVIFSPKITAQNLFANPSFEDINICVEYNASCAAEAWFYIRPTTNPLVNSQVAPRPFAGNNLLLVPVESVYGKKEFNAVYSHPFVYTMLCCPLAKNEKYLLSFYINTAGRKFYTLDFCFTSTEPATDGFDMTKQKPSFSIQLSDIATEEEKPGWRKVNYSFIATGNEKFCIIGNLSPQPWGFKSKDRMNSGGAVYYFLDEINLVSAGNLPLCKEYIANVKKMYEQNYRHTTFALADKPLDTIAAKPPSPVFITDTTILPSALFQTNSAVVKPAFIEVMDSLAAFLPAKKIAKIEIVGHTDNRGTVEKNNALSLARAESVKNYFNTKLPQYNDIIFVTGKGQDAPVADNSTEAGRIRNRRVEIILTIVEKK
jgi:outer membrane protein OmpA-like peptidoglycan-associated protein